MPNLDAWSPRVLSVLRIITALLFMEHGLMKLFHFPGAPEGLPDPLPTIAVVAGWLEIVGGGLVVLGLATRAAAFLLSGEMAVAYFIAHVSRGGFWPGLNGGEGAILFCFFFFYLVFAGPGPWSLDDALSKRR